MLNNLIIAYTALLKIPTHYRWRIENQAIYTLIRDEIAKQSSHDVETVQNMFELLTNMQNMGNK